MRQLSQQNTHRIIEENRKLQSDIQGMMDELDRRNKQIEELSAQGECNSRELELEKQKVRDSIFLLHIFLIRNSYITAWYFLRNSLVICVVYLVFLSLMAMHIVEMMKIIS